jgi:hypothetical protein
LLISGIGCGTMVLIVAGLIVGGMWFVRDAISAFEKADGTMSTIAQRYGPIQEFHPDPVGAVPAERIEAFLLVRERTKTQRNEIEQSLTALSDNESGGLSRVVAGFRLLRQSAGLVARRGEVLLDNEMSLGEYGYLYSLVYYGWLGESPADGPSFQLVGDDGYVLEKVFEGTPEAEVREHRDEITRSSLNEMLLPVLRNQLIGLDALEEGDPGDPWRTRLAAEIAALESDPLRLPWQDGLPEVLEASLHPYRDRLANSYGPMSNAIEVGVLRR